MSRFDHDRLMTVLGEALELPRARRMAFLDSTCVGEPGLRREVAELLELAEPASRAFDYAADAMLRADPEQIGPYTIVEPIGEGGMAIVYKAQQETPVKRVVALKLIKLGMDTRQFIARFEAERQTLAMMDHPGIAKIHDAGATETGRPYFVMELVSGRPIFEYCDEHGLSVRERLELFKVVCLAVEHAHRKGIIHRDIKSSNVLITKFDGTAAPKVIDFGVAKAIQEPLTDRTLQTEQGQLIGTPEYMSPEQAERGAIDIDTRSDVYSLGVLLYELMAGVQPISSELLRSAGYEQVQRIIRESEPPRPSARLSTLGSADAARIAQRRGTSLPTLIRDLRRELEWIPLKAMRRDREQRYRSAAELADDIRNYLEKRPLIAGPESTRYRLGKFLRRHKAGVAASAAMVLLLIGGIVATTWQAVRAAHERDNAKATLSFLRNDVLAGATPERIPDAKVRDQIVNAMITPAAERVGASFQDRPLIEASIRETISEVLTKIGRVDLALPHAEAVASIRGRELGEDDPETHTSVSNLAYVLRGLGRNKEAEHLLRELLEKRPHHQNKLETLTFLNQYASVLEASGRAAEAEPLFKEILEKRRRLLGDDDPHTLNAINNYGHVLGSVGRTAEGTVLYKEVLERRQRVQGHDHPDTMQALNSYAAALRTLDRVTEAEPLFKESLDRHRRVLGEDHPATLMALNNYAYVLKSLNRRAEANPMLKEVYERRQRVLGVEHQDAIWSTCEYAVALQSENKLDEAELLLKDSLERARRVLGADHFLSLSIMNNYAAFLRATQRIADAEPLLKETLARRQRVLGESHPVTLISLNNYAATLHALGRADEAEPLARRAVATATTHPSLGPNHRETRGFATTHAKLLDRLDRPTEAAALRKEFGLPDPATQPSTSPK